MCQEREGVYVPGVQTMWEMKLLIASALVLGALPTGVVIADIYFVCRGRRSMFSGGITCPPPALHVGLEDEFRAESFGEGGK